jgi:pilus assembly protein FimV
VDTEEAAETEEALTAGSGDQLGGDLGIDFNPDEDREEEAVAKVEDTAVDSAVTEDAEAQEAEEAAAAPLEFESLSTGEDFAATEELTIDADLEQAAATISGEAADLETADAQASAALEEDDLALKAETGTEAEALLDDLDLETATEADDEFDFQDEGDSANTKLDLARAYIDMGDADGARDILKEVLDEGNADQQQKAQSMLETL